MFKELLLVHPSRKTGVENFFITAKQLFPSMTTINFHNRRVMSSGDSNCGAAAGRLQTRREERAQPS